MPLITPAPSLLYFYGKEALPFHREIDLPFPRIHETVRGALIAFGAVVLLAARPTGKRDADLFETDALRRDGHALMSLS